MNPTNHDNLPTHLSPIYYLLQRILAQAKLIRDWNWYDLLGGNMMISWDKRKQIRALSQHLAKLQTLLHQASQDMVNFKTQLPLQDYDALWQPWIEKKMTDFKIHQEISNLVTHLEELNDCLFTFNPSS